MSDEGQKAIEAAADAMPWDDEVVADYQAAARKVIRAYLAALTGWRLVPIVPEERGFSEGVSALIRTGLDGPDGVGHSDVAVCFTAVLRVAPPPPGLED